MNNESEIRETIRRNLIELRKEKGLSQTDVAQLVGKSKNAVGSWEQGLSLPDIETLYRLAVYYQKSLDFMYGVNENDNKKKE